jgi:hypothetical protein
LSPCPPRSQGHGQPGLDNRHRDKDGTVARKHANTLIGKLRRTYGENFARGIADTEKLADVLDRIDERSLSQLIHDSAEPRRPIGYKTP